jgi:RNA polymerase sigma-70 factor (ECF subfamily)
VVQEVMLAVHRAMADWEPSNRAGSFRAWLAEAARRITLQVVRQRGKADCGTGGSSVRAVLESIQAADDGAADEESENRRWLFFCAAAEVEGQVHESTWHAFWRTAVENESVESVARELGFSVGNVYSARCRVMARIRRRIDELSRDER